jgi:hypothetical protein
VFDFWSESLLLFLASAFDQTLKSLTLMLTLLASALPFHFTFLLGIFRMAFAVIPVRTFVLVGWGDSGNLACWLVHTAIFRLGCGFAIVVAATLRFTFGFAIGIAAGVTTIPIVVAFAVEILQPVGFANWVSSWSASMELGVVCEGLFDGE